MTATSSSPSKRWALMAFSAAVALATGGYFWFGAGEGKAADGAEEARRAGATRSAGGQGLERMGCRFKPGDRLAYRFKNRLDITMNTRGVALMLGQDPSQGETVKAMESGEGLLEVKALRNDGDDMMFVGAWLEPKLESGQGKDILQHTAPEKLSAPFLFRLDSQCRLTSFAFEDKYPDILHRRLRGLLQSMEMVAPEQPAARQWSTLQTDVFGQYHARYDRDGQLAAKRRRTRFQKLWGQTSQVSRYVIRDSKSEVAFAPEEKWLRKLHTYENLFAQAEKASPPTQLEFTFEAEATEPGPDPFRGLDLSTVAMTWYGAHSAPPDPPATDDPDPPWLKTAKLDEVLARYAEIVRGKAGGNPVLDAAKLIAAYIRARPEMAQEIFDRIKAKTIDEDLEATLFLGLQLAGNAAAHDVLMSASRDTELHQMARLRAIAALHSFDNPTDQTLNALLDLSTRTQDEETDAEREARRTAVLGLGVLASEAEQKGNTELSQKAVEVLSDRVASTEDPDELAYELQSVGNSGNQALADDVAPLLESEDPALRAAATAAHRRMPPAATESWMPKRFSEETDHTVRRTMLDTYQEQVNRNLDTPSAEMIQMAASQLPVEANATIRGQLIRLLGGAVPSSTVAKEALIRHFPNEPKGELKRLIGMFVSASDLAAGVP